MPRPCRRFGKGGDRCVEQAWHHSDVLLQVCDAIEAFPATGHGTGMTVTWAAVQFR